MASITYTNFSKLVARGDEAVLVVKLMMALNDLSVANEGLAHAKKQLAEKRRTERNRGAGMYFVRLQASHLYEAMNIYDEVAKHSRLRQVIEAGPAHAKEAFHRLAAVRSDQTAKAKFEQYVGRLRNNLTFHYDESGDLVKKAMTRRDGSADGNHTSLTRGTDTYGWRFTIADDVVDTIVCREIWKIPDAADIRQEADAAADYGHGIFIDFADFASDLVVRYVRDGA